MISRIHLYNLAKQSESEFIRALSEQFPSETALLSGEVQCSPGITHELVSDFKENELPSGILLAHGLLKNPEKYDRKNFVELNRGFASAIALRQVLIGGDDNYKAFKRGQAASVALTREQYDAMHEEYNTRLNTSQLKMAAIYMAAFNDVGKSLTLLEEASKMKGEQILDHDEANALIVSSPLKRKALLPGLDALDEEVRNLICRSVGLDFNPSCFTQGEYPLYPVVQIATALNKVPEHLRKDIFSLIKIESAMDVAGVRGHQAPGGAAYIKFVHPAFDLAFNQLADLIKGKPAKEVYLNYINMNAKKFGLDEISDENEKIALTRIALMIRATNTDEGKLILDTMDNLKKEHPAVWNNLIKELGTNNIAVNKSSMWMQYSPDLLRILTKENKSGQSPIEGLTLGLKIYHQVLLKAAGEFIGKNICYMVQGRELIPIVRKAATGDLSAMKLLTDGSEGHIAIENSIVTFQSKKPPEYKVVKATTPLGEAIVDQELQSKSSNYSWKKIALGVGSVLAVAGLFAISKSISKSGSSAHLLSKSKL